MKTQYPDEAIKIVSMSRTKQTVVCMAGSLSLNMTGNLEKLLPFTLHLTRKLDRMFPYPFIISNSRTYCVNQVPLILDTNTSLQTGNTCTAMSYSKGAFTQCDNDCNCDFRK